MNLNVQIRDVANPNAAAAYAAERVEAALRRFSHALTSVEVRIGDVNGPRGGVDKYCRVTVKGPLVGELSVVRDGIDVRAAVRDSSERMARALANRFDRIRSRRRRLRPEMAPRLAS